MRSFTSTRTLVSKCIVKISFAIILSIIFSLVLSSLAPHLSNDLAIGQLENDDFSWSLMNSWYKIQEYAWIVYTVIGCTFGASIGKDVYNFIKSKEEN